MTRILSIFLFFDFILVSFFSSHLFWVDRKEQIDKTIDKYLDLAKEQAKTVKHESQDDINCYWRAWNIYSGFGELVIFPNTIFLRQHKWMTELCFNNTTKVLYLQHGIWFAFGAARLVVLRLISVGDEMVWRDVEMAACCWTCEGLCLESPCIFVCLIFLGESMRYVH